MIAADSAKSSEPLRSSVSVEEGRDLEQSVIPSKHVSGSGGAGVGGGTVSLPLIHTHSTEL